MKILLLIHYQDEVPKILNDIIETNHFNSNINQDLEDLASTILEYKITEIESSNNENWEKFYNEYRNTSLTEVPFFFAEIYFYELILSITQYHENKVDPFGVIKKQEVLKALDAYNEAVSNFGNTDIKNAILFSLIGNKADLSQLDRVQSPLKIIIDHSEELISSIIGANHIHIILDNSGTELFSDLYLALKILDLYPEKKLIIYPKTQPLLVSDAMQGDIDILLKQLEEEFSSKYNQHVSNGRIQVRLLSEWCLPMHFTDMKSTLSSEIDKNDVLISKGDANYRRFYEDRVVPTDFVGGAQLCNKQFALRTLKSEIIAGLDKNKATEIGAEDKDWMKNGKYAVIQKLK